MSKRRWQRKARNYTHGIRRPTVYYLKNEPFLDRKGGQVVFGTEPQTTGSLVLAVMAGWQPTREIRESALTPAQIRTWQKLLDDMEKGPQDGYYALEDDRWTLVKQLIIPMMQSPSFGVVISNRLVPIAQYVPQMEDVLNAVTNKKPETEAPPVSPDGVAALEKVTA